MAPTEGRCVRHVAQPHEQREQVVVVDVAARRRLAAASRSLGRWQADVACVAVLLPGPQQAPHGRRIDLEPSRDRVGVVVLRDRIALTWPSTSTISSAAAALPVALVRS